MTALSMVQAEKVYEILDTNIGVFREKEMNAGAKKYHNEQREKFINTFTTSIPESFWFQGAHVSSAILYYYDDKFEIDVMNHSKESNHVISTVNAQIAKALKN